MERKKNILITLFSLSVLFAFGQNNKSIYNSFISGDISVWKTVIDSLGERSNKTSKDKLDLVNYQYGYIAWCIDNKEKDRAEYYIEASEKLIADLEAKQYEIASLYAYKAALVGFEIGITPVKAPFIGPRSQGFANKAIKAEPDNVLGNIQLGNLAFYTPKMFGGSKEKAVSHYENALSLMEKEPASLKNNWNYLNLLVTIINAHVELETYEKAKLNCQKALRIEPKFDWVKNELYPLIQKKTNNE